MAPSHNRSAGGARLHPTSRLALVAAVAFAIPTAVLVPMLPADRVALPGTTAVPEQTAEADLNAELTRLRAERQRWLDGTTDRTARTEVTGAVPVEATATIPPSPTAGVSLQARDAVAVLLTELGAQVEAGALTDHFLQNPVGLARLVLDGWSESGHPERALALLRRLPPGMVDADTFVRLAERFAATNDKQGAKEIYLTAMLHGEDDWRFSRGIAAIDPEAGLAQLRARNAQDAFGPVEGFRLQELDLLLACNRQEEAEAALAILMAEQPITADGGSEWLHVLLQRAPAKALEVLAQGAAKALHPSQIAELEATAHKAAGDAGAAKSAALVALRHEPGNWSAWYMLSELDPAAALEFLDARSGPDVEGEFAARRAELLARTGRTDEATGILLVLAETHWDRASDMLLRVAPETAIARARMRRDDEVLGDAADNAWRAGQHERAVQLWGEAARIDPGDGEWQGNLRRVRLGLDPLGGN